MRIRSLSLMVLGLLVPQLALASPDMGDDRSIFHYVRLETDIGSNHGKADERWDLDAWLGGDLNKLWIKSEGEVTDGSAEQGEVWGFYSRNVATFWDLQAGIRQDFVPGGRTYLAFGINGLAPYYFETEAHVFISEDGDISARLKESNDFLITQRLITQPYIEINLYTSDDRQQRIGAGVAGEVGVQTRYEFTRQFAPYLDLRYEDNFGNTGDDVEDEGIDRASFIASVGLRLLF